MKILLINLFKTFIISVAITAALSCIYYTVLQKDSDYSKALPAIVSGVFLLDLILLVMSLPVLFLSYSSYWSNSLVRLLLYFCGPVCFIIATFNIKVKPQDGYVYLATGVIFLLVHAFFYYKADKHLINN